MTDLEDKADQESQEDVILIRNGAGSYRMEGKELVDCSEIGTEDYPRFGEFLSVSRQDGGPAWLECPGDLARTLVKAGVQPGEPFEIVRTTKNAAGRWEVEADTSPAVDSLDEAVDTRDTR